MTSTKNRWSEPVYRILSSFGIELPSAKRGTSNLKVFVYGPTPSSDNEWIGTLFQEEGNWVFRYTPEYRKKSDAVALPAFPEVDEEYRSRRLWPFFSIRLPSPEREDMQRVLSERKVKPDETLRVLGLICARSVASPYLFKLAG